MASSSFANTVSTASCASRAANLVAFTPSVLIFSAAALAWFSSSDNCSNFALYASTLSGVLPSVLVSTSFATVFSNFAFWASVAAGTKFFLAASNSAFLTLISANAFATSSTVEFSLAITAAASSTALSAAVFAIA